MADELKPEEFSFSQTQEFNKTDGTNTAISELSKKGYQYLKDNSTKEAIEAFNQILNIEENNPSWKQLGYFPLLKEVYLMKINSKKKGNSETGRKQGIRITTSWLSAELFI